MSLLPAEQQHEAFEALRADPFLSSDYNNLRVHVPELIVVQELEEPGVEAWLEATRVRYEDETAADTAAYKANRDFYIPGPRIDGVVGLDDAGVQHNFSFSHLGQDRDSGAAPQAMRFLLPSWCTYYQGDLRVVPGIGDGFDMMVTRTERTRQDIEGRRVEIERLSQVVDINSAVAVSARHDEEEFERLSEIPFSGVTRAQAEFIKQARTLMGGAGEAGYELLDTLPFMAVCRFTVAQALGHEDFTLPFALGYDRKLEVRPLTEYLSQPKVDVDISHIQADVEYRQEDEPWLMLAGSGIISGKAYRLRAKQTEPVPDDSIVLIDDECDMNYLPAAVIAPAAAIITRGFTGEEGIRNDSHDHIGIIGRSLAQERPGEFIYLMVPWMNPRSDELAKWNELKKSSVLTVASDGKNFKMLAGEIKD